MRRIAAVTPVDPARAPRPATVASPGAGAIGTIARDLAANPPLAEARVAGLRAAIAQRRYPIDPAAVADRMLAARKAWRDDPV